MTLAFVLFQALVPAETDGKKKTIVLASMIRTYSSTKEARLASSQMGFPFRRQTSSSSRPCMVVFFLCNPNLAQSLSARARAAPSLYPPPTSGKTTAGHTEIVGKRGSLQIHEYWDRSARMESHESSEAMSGKVPRDAHCDTGIHAEDRNPVFERPQCFAPRHDWHNDCTSEARKTFAVLGTP